MTFHSHLLISFDPGIGLDDQSFSSNQSQTSQLYTLKIQNRYFVFGVYLTHNVCNFFFGNANLSVSNTNGFLISSSIGLA
jgi:hypothetical protein